MEAKAWAAEPGGSNDIIPILKVILTIGGLHPESGGPSRTIPALVEALARRGVDVEIVSLNYGRTFNAPIVSISLPVTYVDCSSPIARCLQWSPRFQAVLHERCRKALARAGNLGLGAQEGCSNGTIIHDTGLWLLTNHAAAKAGRDFNLARIVSPRGMLSSWALSHKGWKKKLAWWLYQRRDLKAAQVLHATSQAEADEFRAVGLKQPIAVIPNGVALPPDVKSEIGNRKSEIHTVLFLSRIHPVKGLLNLVRAWAMIRNSENGKRKVEKWRVIVAGGDEGGHLNQVKAEVRIQKMESDFEFVGEVAGPAKWDWYRSADLFVLPSHSENFGLVIAEALACGLPAITTRGTPWEDLVTHRCGWWVNIGVEPLAGALREAMNLSDEERHEMGKRGRNLAAEKFSWPAIATQMESVYKWMLENSARPEAIQL
jgi:glycosyltransferase involved in cell wall biosynthesis